ncbi:hypothetical protein DFH27DRAFT_497873 [Peziza echinospora]|nr:hypothetical protein DFH27DRAFT_497873 [Peziza echinospora]
MPSPVQEVGLSTPAKSTRSKAKGSVKKVKMPIQTKASPVKKPAKAKVAKQKKPQESVGGTDSIEDAIVLALPSATEKAHKQAVEEVASAPDVKKARKDDKPWKIKGDDASRRTEASRAAKVAADKARRNILEIPKWKQSQSHGGRFLPIDPVFSNDEQFVFIAVPNSLKVYSSKTSLFVRSFDLPGINDDIALDSDSRIVSFSIDPLDGKRIFLATYSGWVYLWDWTLGQLVESWDTGRNIQLMEVAKGEEEVPAPVEEEEQYTIPTSGRMVYIISRPYEGTPSKNAVEVAKPAAAIEAKQAESTDKLQLEFEIINKFTDQLVQKQIAELKSRGEWDWFFHKAILLPKGANGNNTTVELRVLFRVPKPVTAFKVAAKGEIFVAIGGNTMWIGNRNETPVERGYGKLPVWGVWRSVDVKNQASCLDIQVFAEGKGKKGKGVEKKLRGLVAVGDVTGAIFLWHNILTPGSTGDQPGDIRRMHWHRGCVGSVKISEDGHYLISGGNETVLVLWQIDTGFKQFLPHITSAIESIVVSPTGASYAIRLADNSVMVLSTTELKPKANIPGFQSASIPLRLQNQPDTSVIKTIDNITSKPTLTCPRVQCAVHPTKQNQILLATSSHSTSTIILAGNNQVTEPAPYLQTYDITTDRAVAKQALARTNASDFKIGPLGNTLVEPNVALLSISNSGEWLATLDEWTPPSNDLTDSTDPELVDGKEVYLKFWRKDEKNGWGLATRVDSPHPSPVSGMLGGGAKVFDLLALPSSSLTRSPVFASLGADGCVRIWKSRVRTRKGGEKVTDGVAEQVNWNCRKVIQFAKSTPTNAHGAMTVSQDGSVIAVAISTPAPKGSTAVESTAIYILDPDSTVIHHTLLGIQAGLISALRITDRYLVILGTRKLVVFDLVRGAVKWDVPTQILAGKIASGLTPASLFLDAGAVPGNGVIVGINVPPTPAKEPADDKLLVIVDTNKKASSNVEPRHTARILIFDPATEAPRPVYSNTLSQNVGITAVKALATGGYIYLDTFSRIKTLLPTHQHHEQFTVASSFTTTTTPTAKPSSSSSSSTPSTFAASSTTTTPSGLSSIYDTTATSASADVGVEEMEDANPRPPVAPEVLSNVFFGANDSSAVYGMVEMQDVFERVMGLYARPPLSADEGKVGDEMEID